MSSNLSDACGSSSRDGNGGVNNGDWICGDVTCHHSNFARRQQCKKCKRDRSLERSSSVGSGGSNKKKLGTEIGKAAAEKSRGLFSAEDWQCNKCANVNWARRTTCNMCNAPKFCDVEERTGFGGGYNDRGVVEYKEREESDSEYDEFGRLKKRSSAKSQNDSKQERSLEEEDDDEEDDDGDLAKYNLFSDDEEIQSASISKNSKKSLDTNDEVTTKPTTDMVKSTNRRSRSRTRSDFKRRQSNSSSRSSSSTSTSSSSSSSSTSSSSTSSSEKLSRLPITRDLQSRSKKRSHSSSRSRTKSPSKIPRSSSEERSTRKRSNDKSKSATSECRSRYSSKSRSLSRSSYRSSRSPSSKRNRSRNSSLSRKQSPRSHRKRATRSRSTTPKRRN